jgi:hypothetical protein
MDNSQRPPFLIRDPILARLAAESPIFEEQHAELAPAVRNVRELYQRKILILPGVKSGLEKLRASGIKPERVLMCLAALVQLECDATWKNDTEKIKRRLLGLSKRLRDITGKIERAYCTDAMRPDLYALSLGFWLAMPTPYDSRKTVERMRETVVDLEAKAAAFGRLRKKIIPKVRRAPVVALLRHVTQQQPWSPAFPLELRMVVGELLEAVCKKYEIEASFTPDSLLQIFKRHVLPRSLVPASNMTPSKKARYARKDPVNPEPTRRGNIRQDLHQKKV